MFQARQVPVWAWQSGDGKLDIKELVEGLPQVIPGISVTMEDWFHMTGSEGDGSHGQALNSHFNIFLTEPDFRKWCLRELKAYLIRASNKVSKQVCDVSFVCCATPLLVSTQGPRGTSCRGSSNDLGRP